MSGRFLPDQIPSEPASIYPQKLRQLIDKKPPKKVVWLSHLVALIHLGHLPGSHMICNEEQLPLFREVRLQNFQWSPASVQRASSHSWEQQLWEPSQKAMAASWTGFQIKPLATPYASHQRLHHGSYSCLRSSQESTVDANQWNHGRC